MATAGPPAVAEHAVSPVQRKGGALKPLPHRYSRPAGSPTRAERRGGAPGLRADGKAGPGAASARNGRLPFPKPGPGQTAPLPSVLRVPGVGGAGASGQSSRQTTRLAVLAAPRGCRRREGAGDAAGPPPQPGRAGPANLASVGRGRDPTLPALPGDPRGSAQPSPLRGRGSAASLQPPSPESFGHKERGHLSGGLPALPWPLGSFFLTPYCPCVGEGFGRPLGRERGKATSLQQCPLLSPALRKLL
nr:collagen alpha-1(I) chain-like [Delphinus delphis]